MTLAPINHDAIAGVPAYCEWKLRPRRSNYVVVIPVINEGGRLLAQLSQMREVERQFDVLVADGGSSDGSVDPTVLKDLGVTTLLVKTGPGKLSAQLRMAFWSALQGGYEGIVTIDGNGKDGVQGISQMIGSLEAGYDFVQGSRFIPGGVAEHTPRVREVGIRLVHAPLTSVAARRRYTDTTNGFRAHSRQLLLSPEVDVFRDIFDTYELLAYIPIVAARQRFRVCEIPVSRRYPERGDIPTKISGRSAHVNLLKILLNAVRGRYGPRGRSELSPERKAERSGEC